MHTALAWLALFPLPHEPSDWPQWRGIEGDGLSHGTGWASEGTERWRAEIGLGYSAPVVSDGRVIAFGFDAERSVDVLRALGLEDGAEQWRVEWPGELRANQHEGGTLSTPAVEGGRVYTSSSSGVVRCHAAEDGKEVWVRDLAAELEVDPGYYGFAGSPLVLDGRVYLALDRAVALDAGTGAVVWKSESLEALYSTPARIDVGGAGCVAVFGQRGLDVLTRDSGAPRASFPFRQGDRLVNAATPVVAGARVFVSSAYEHGCALVELPAEPGAARAVWESKAMRNKMAGCVLVDGHLYGFDESVLKCLDLEGAERWRVRGLGSGAISGGDGKLAVLSSSGELVVARASGERFEELTRAPLFDEGVCWTPPTIAGGRLFLRNNRGQLVCRDHRDARSDGTPVAAARGTAASGAAELRAAETLFEAHRTALGGAAKVASLETLDLRGTYEQRSVGFVPAPYRVRWAAPGLRRVDVQLPPPLDKMFERDGVPGHIGRVCDGTHVFELNAYRGDKLYGPAEEREERAGAVLMPLAPWSTLVASAATVARETFDERDCWRVAATLRDGRTRTLWFDAATGLLAGREAEDEALAVYRDYRRFEGVDVLLPAFERVFRPDGGIEEIFRLEQVSTAPLPEGTFASSEAVQALLEERAATPR